MQADVLVASKQCASRAVMEPHVRPSSQMSDNVYTEFEDDESDVEQSSLTSSNQSLDDRRRSDTTVSSYNEATTPETEDGQFQLIIKPVEGPQGPHLFRSSQMSADFMLDFALQMSPLDLKAPPPSNPDLEHNRSAPTPRPDTAASHRTSPRRSRRSLSPMMVDLPGLPANIHDWAASDVADWLYNADVEMSIIRAFRDNDISGTVLADMEFEDLKDLGIPSFGKRHQVWSIIEDLTGGGTAPSPAPTPFQDIQSPHAGLDEDFEFPRSACSSTSIEDMTPVEQVGRRRKKSRKGRKSLKPKSVDQLDLGRMSFLAIEETLPEEHICEKGHDCSKWKRWQRRVQKAKDFNQRLNPSSGCSVTYNTSQSQSHTTQPCGQPRERVALPEARPISESVPSVVASSDVFGPSQIPDFALQEAFVQRLEKTDPQENVKTFLELQHVSSPLEAPAPPGFSPLEPEEAAQPVHGVPQPHVFHEEPSFEIFPASFYQPPCAPAPPSTSTPGAHEHLKHLPKLSIPRAATASPSLARRQASARSPVSPQSTGRSPILSTRSHVVSPLTTSRTGTPASEMDVGSPAQSMCPPQRDFSYSVPPNMHYRDPATVQRPPTTRPEARRPSFAMPALAEVLETQPNAQRSLEGDGRVSGSSCETTPVEFQKGKALYGPDCAHAGWMKKRRTRLLRHEWQESHFRLHGTQLAMHSTDGQTSVAKDTIDVDNYTVNCSTAAANSKLSAALKTLRMRGAVDEGPNAAASAAAAFNFQLVPEAALRRRDPLGVGQGKTHHFAVTSRDDRMDWMREVMLAKAKGQRCKGFEVKVDGDEQPASCPRYA